MPIVYSTLTNDNTYCFYMPRQEGDLMNNIERQILIKGGHNRPTPFDKSTFAGVHTPYGVATTVSDEDFKYLLEHVEFKAHHERGFITYDKTSSEKSEAKLQEKAEKAAKNMKQKDRCSPMTNESYESSDYSDDSISVIKRKGA